MFRRFWLNPPPHNGWDVWTLPGDIPSIFLDVCPSSGFEECNSVYNMNTCLPSLYTHKIHTNQSKSSSEQISKKWRGCYPFRSTVLMNIHKPDWYLSFLVDCWLWRSKVRTIFHFFQSFQVIIRYIIILRI